jgi:carboxymethylenebutenolidase
MPRTIRLRASDGHELGAYVAEAKGKAKGGIVIVQEIFGVTGHIRRVADQYAAQGYKTVAPAMFDRVRRNVELDYKDIEKGRALMLELKWPGTLADVAAAIGAVDDAGRVAVVGYCWGGTVAHVAAAELRLAAAVSYYGGGVAKQLDKKPRCKVMYHFGDRDHAIPMADIEQIKRAYPNALVHVYAGAGHGFNCDERASFSPKDAQVAFERSLSFLDEHVRSQPSST